MSAYTKAASFVLDTLWEADDFRAFFYGLDLELADLGPLSQKVFEPAYVAFRGALDDDALFMLESQVTQDLMAPLLQRPKFRDIWQQWDEATREEFIKEQAELQLARLLIQVYDEPLAAAYRAAYTTYAAQHDTD
ncbi:MAG: hypothetical protein JW910_19140 [Anaerolineae bacterium]|nr:hypothetical protein [Anaerolineae bacterium]